MAKKGQAVQLQQEVNTNEEWEKLLQKDGLTVVDVYSEWCGPCSAMIANLKKLKLEVGGDNLHLAIVKSDKIGYLERFRNKSEPTWMFISRGKMVNLMFGANAPKLINLIIEELKKEAAVKDGTLEREYWEITEMAPEERIRYERAKAMQAKAVRIETEKQQKVVLEKRTGVANVVLQNGPNYGVIIVFPQAKDLYKAALSDFWELEALAIAATEKPSFNEAMIEELLYFAETSFSETDVVNLISEAAFAFLIKPTQGEDFDGDIDEAVLRLVYGDSKCPPGNPESPAQQLLCHILVPKEVKESVTALEVEKQISNNNEISSPLVLNAEATQNLQSKADIRSQLKVLSKTILRAKDGFSKQTEFKASVKDSEQTENEEENEESYLEIKGIWAPPNAFTRATAIKLLFPKIYDPIALQEPKPVAPHIAVAYEAFKRRDIEDLMNQFPEDIMRYGFFTDDNPETAKLIVKTIPKFEKLQATETTYGERLVIQVAKKSSETLCAFSQLGPTFMSHNTVEGEHHCKLFFSDNYDEPEEAEGVTEVKKKKKKSRKSKVAAAEETVVEEQHATDAQTAAEEEHAEGYGEAEAEGEGEGESEGEDATEIGLPMEADKATSPMPEE